jgi:peptidyl-prolyl cis-trans isomerase SurA
MNKLHRVARGFRKPMNIFDTMTPSKTHRSRRPLALLLVCAALAAAPQAWSQASSSGERARAVTADSILVVVNDEVITRNELEARLQSIQLRMRAQKIAMPPVDEFRKQLLERMIVDKAQLQLARETGIRVDDAFLDRAIGRIAESNKLSVQEFRNQIEREGVGFARFREEIRDDILMQRVREREVDNRVQISQAEIDHYLEGDNGTATTQEELNLAQILVRIPENANAEQIYDRRRRAEEVLRQLRSGGEFAKLAATFSDASDALTGGELGWRPKDRLPELFVEAVATLKPGQISQIIKSPNGFHIIKLVDQRTVAVKPASAAAAAGVQQTHVRHILIKVNQVVTAADAKRKLLELKERLVNKAATFEELAKLHSVDGSASKGGDLGWIYPGDTVPEFERAMDELGVGAISDPVESQFGWHLIQVLERKKDEVSPERQRMAARQVLRERKAEEATQDWLRQLRDRAYVEYRN